MTREELIAHVRRALADSRERSYMVDTITMIDATLDAVEQAIRAKFTPSLNTGTAMDALILAGGVLRELRGEVEHGK